MSTFWQQIEWNKRFEEEKQAKREAFEKMTIERECKAALQVEGYKLKPSYDDLERIHHRIIEVRRAIPVK